MGAYGVGCEVNLGKVIGVQPNGDTWAYDYATNNWQQLSMISNGSTGTKFITYDMESEKIILVDVNGGPEIWSYDYGTDTWTEMLSHGLSNISGMTYDVDSDRIILVDYYGNVRTYDYNENNIGFGTDLSSSTTGTKLLTYDDDNDRTILVDSNGETWSSDFNNSIWVLHNAEVGTCPGGTSITYDYVSNRTILVKPNGETWEFFYDENTWTMLDNIGNGSTGNKYITYDIDNDKTILVDAGNEQTWVYDYPTHDWTYLNTNTSLELSGFSLTVVQNVPSTTWHVSTSGSDDNNGSEENHFATIQQGIDASSDGDTVLVQTGTYVENINYNGKNIVVGSLFLTTSDTSYISSTIIDGNQIDRVVTFTNGEDSTAVLKGLTITNGDHINGGGIQLYGSSPSLSYLRVIGNSSSNGNGGGIWCADYSNPVIEYCTISSNWAEGAGGGMMLHNYLYL